MKKFETEWHKYPEEKPDRDDIYIVSLVINGAPCSWISHYTKEDGFYEDFMGSVVKAWAEMPQHYEEDNYE